MNLKEAIAQLDNINRRCSEIETLAVYGPEESLVSLLDEYNDLASKKFELESKVLETSQATNFQGNSTIYETRKLLEVLYSKIMLFSLVEQRKILDDAQLSMVLNNIKKLCETKSLLEVSLDKILVEVELI